MSEWITLETFDHAINFSNALYIRMDREKYILEVHFPHECLDIPFEEERFMEDAFDEINKLLSCREVS